MIMLAALSPFVAEFLLGDQYLAGLAAAPQQIVMFVMFMAFYGMAAVLIRELARRLRIGWTGLLLLALGYGIFEEGLITQSLFNPHYLGLSLIEPGYLPGLGIGAPWTVFVISLHVIWSIATPIAITEAWYGRADPGGRGTEPWLGRIGTIVCLVIFVLAAAATAVFSVFSDDHHFAAPALRLAAAAVAAALAVVAAISRRRRQTQAVPATLQSTALSALFAAVATGAFQVVNKLPGLSPWLGTAALLAIWLAAVLIMRAWHRRGSGPVPLGLAAGAVITYCWVGMFPAVRAGGAADIEQVVLVIIALAMIGWTAARSLRTVQQPRQERSPALR
ncbi:hypothetical protein [Microlunatus sp. Gsoil 973]|uniref:hypothetical protein n=1 Tax=Microlunatus sp. Gsoil 973 TaxID=2672569 RepID=UPI0012B46289|nr:hypothetical protein [Microlunatus sp. Gsoil 973]QGN31842.1 hypothetical protein GJV80_02330 [Microlunatus sp. Gsoil 973]